jgi:nicotinamidase-related amidase
MTELPKVPDPAAVTLDPATTAVLVLDIHEQSIAAPAVKATVPAIAKLVGRARAAKARVVFSLGRFPGQEVLPELDPRPDDPIVKTSADKFFRTDLEQHLAGMTHAIVTGTAANGAVVYTAFACCARGITVVVPVDTIGSREEIATEIAKWQLLQQPGYANVENKPLEKGRVTLSRTDLITFGRGV